MGFVTFVYKYMTAILDFQNPQNSRTILYQSYTRHRLHGRFALCANIYVLNIMNKFNIDTGRLLEDIVIDFIVYNTYISRLCVVYVLITNMTCLLKRNVIKRCNK